MTGGELIMCEFISWIAINEKAYFLTKAQMDSPQGQALKLRFPGKGELLGHGAIRAYYEIDGGVELELTDFLSPDNFPDVIVRAIKRGDFRGIAQPLGPLSPSAQKKYEAVADTAQKKYKAVADTAQKQYEAVVDPAQKKYKAVADTAQKQYEAVADPAQKKYEAVVGTAQKQYRAVADTAQKKYKAVADPAQKKYEAVADPAQKQYEAVADTAFWDLFANNRNRAEAWRD
jgi:archaellum component FlaG (FlaF/FlaG flagellin family)